MLTTVVASAVLLAQRSEAEIASRRESSQLFTPTIERMMRATDKQLIVLAGSTEPETRLDAVGEIVERHLKSAALPLTKQLWPKVSDPGKAVTLQVTTIEGLGRLGNPAAIPALRKMLVAKPFSVKVASAFSLGWLGDRKSAPAMRPLLKDLPELKQRLFVRILGNLGDRGSEPAIRDLLQTAHYQDVRTTAAEALGSIGNRKTSVPALIAALKDAYPDVRFAAANSLAKLGDPRAVPALKVALHSRSAQASNAPGMERRSIAAIQDALKTLGAG